MTPTATPVTYGLDALIARFSVARYQRMIETGILTPEDKVELLENNVVFTMPRNPPHEETIQLFTEAIATAIPQGWRLRVQSTVVFADSQPEPDLSIVRGDARTYLTHHPSPRDAGLIVEIADSSRLRDQRDKTRIYARGCIPCYWIVNLVDRRIEVYTQPSGPSAVPAYASFQLYQPGDAVPLMLDGNIVATVPVDELLP
jgi:Uma2 family endonuclease